MVTDEVTIRGAAATALAFAAALFLLHEASELFIPFLLSVLLAYALEPFVSLLTRARVPRPAAALVVFMMVATAIGAGARTARDQIDAFADDMPNTVATFRRAIEQARGAASGAGPLTKIQNAAREVGAASRRTPTDPEVVRVTPVRRFEVTAFLVNLGLGTLNVAASAFAVALLTFLLLATGDMFKRKLIKLAGPTFERRKVTLEVIRTIDRQIARYLLVRVLISVIVAVATALPLWWLGVAHAFVWGAIAGVLNVLPFIGPSSAVALIALGAFMQFKSPGMTAAAGGVAAAVAALEGNVITPWLTGHACELNTVAVFVSVLFWGWVWGMWGLLLAVPLMVAIKAASDHIEPLQPLGELLGR